VLPCVLDILFDLFRFTGVKSQGTVSSGVLTLFQVGLPGFDIPGLVIFVDERMSSNFHGYFPLALFLNTFSRLSIVTESYANYSCILPAFLRSDLHSRSMLRLPPPSTLISTSKLDCHIMSTTHSFSSRLPASCNLVEILPLEIRVRSMKHPYRPQTTAYLLHFSSGHLCQSLRGIHRYNYRAFDSHSTIRWWLLYTFGNFISLSGRFWSGCPWGDRFGNDLPGFGRLRHCGALARRKHEFEHYG